MNWDDVLVAIQRLGENRQDEEAATVLVSVLTHNIPRYLLAEFSRFDQDDAEDVTEKTLIQVWRHASSFRGQTENEARSWVYRIAKNTGVAYSKQKDKYKKFKFKTKRQSWMIQVESIDSSGEIESNDLSDGQSKQISDDKIENVEERIIREEGLNELREKLTPIQKEVFDGLAAGLNVTKLAKKLKKSKSAISQVKASIETKRHRIFDGFDNAESKTKNK